MPERLQLVTHVLDDATLLLAALEGYDAHLISDGDVQLVEVQRDREFNALLLGVLEAADRCMSHHGIADVSLLVEGRSYPLHADAARPSLVPERTGGPD